MAKTKHQYYFLTAGIAFLAMFAGLVRTASRQIVQQNGKAAGYSTCVIWIGVSALPLITTLFLSIVCFHIFYVRSSNYRTISSLLRTYILKQAIRCISVFVMRKLKYSLKNPRIVQETLLKDRIGKNAQSHYGRRYKFQQIQTLEDLREQHPLTTYEHYAEFVQRMADGEENVLLCEELERFGITSGTTGKGKLIPFPKSRMANIMATYAMMSSAVGQKWGWASPLQKELNLYVKPKTRTTPSGRLVGPVNLITDNMKSMTCMYNNPWEAYSITTEFEANYLTLLFGLRDPNLALFIGPFSSVIHKAMSYMEKNWKRLVNDINTGSIDKDLQIPMEVRRACDQALSPDPERAQELREEFKKGFDGIMRRIWPHLVYILGIDTAGFNDKLENSYARGFAIYTPQYATTEGGIFGANLWPGEKPKYVLLPSYALYEFIPEDQMSDKDPKTLFIDEVSAGETYELVISTLTGFYRYRCGDVVKVVDFHYKTPVVEFMYRSGQLLNLRSEKVTEISVKEAVKHVVDNLSGATLVHWTSAESTLLAEVDDNAVEFEKGAQFYLIFLELEDDADHKEFGKKQQQQFDDALKKRNNYYNGYRDAGTISPPRVYLVKSGTFKALQDYIVANSSASYNQFKLPTKLRTADTLKLMLDNRI